METLKNFVENITIDELRCPPIKYDKKIISLTNIAFVVNSSGDNGYIVRCKNKYIVLLTSIDFDCDGTFYYAYYYKLSDFKMCDITPLNAFEINVNLLTHLYIASIK